MIVQFKRLKKQKERKLRKMARQEKRAIKKAKADAEFAALVESGEECPFSMGL